MLTDDEVRECIFAARDAGISTTFPPGDRTTSEVAISQARKVIGGEDSAHPPWTAFLRQHAALILSRRSAAVQSKRERLGGWVKGEYVGTSDRWCRLMLGGSAHRPSTWGVEASMGGQWWTFGVGGAHGRAPTLAAAMLAADVAAREVYDLDEERAPLASPAPPPAMTVHHPSDALRCAVDAMLRFLCGHPDGERWMGKGQREAVATISAKWCVANGDCKYNKGIIVGASAKSLLRWLSTVPSDSPALSRAEAREYDRLHSALVAAVRE